MNPDENKVVSMTDLFGNFVLPQVIKGTSERGNIIGYFMTQGFVGAKDRVLETKNVASLLSHFTVSQLYALKSAYEDRLKRNGKESARKYWWYAVRTKESPV